MLDSVIGDTIRDNHDEEHDDDGDHPVHGHIQLLREEIACI